MIYLDSAASTPLLPEVREAMTSCLERLGGNPSSPHRAGREARRRLDDARESVAASLGADPKEIVFTSGATESNNLALRGVAGALRDRGDHVVTSAVEHPCVLESCARLEAQGFRVTRIPVAADGRVDPREVARAAGPGTILVSIQWANHEVGTVQPIREIREAARGRVFHVDAAQALGKVPVDLGECDLLTFSGHKLHGPPGTGGLWVRRGTPIEPLLVGGGQEFERRAGTENLPGIVGLAKAISIAVRDLGPNARRMEDFRRRLLGLPGARPNGHPVDHTPHLLSVTFPGIDAEAAVLALDQEGVAVSMGSACASLGREPSPVLRAMGLSIEEAKSSLRLSVSALSTEPEIDQALEILPRVLERLRKRPAVPR